MGNSVPYRVSISILPLYWVVNTATAWDWPLLPSTVPRSFIIKANYLSTLSSLYSFLDRVVSAFLLDEKNKSWSSPVCNFILFCIQALIDSIMLLSAQYTKHIHFLFWDSWSYKTCIQNKRKVEITNYTTFLLCTEVTNFLTAAQFKAWTYTNTFNACKNAFIWGRNVTAIPVNEFHYIKHLNLTNFSRNGSETGSNTFIKHMWMTEIWNIWKSVEAQIHWINYFIKCFFTFSWSCINVSCKKPPCHLAWFYYCKIMGYIAFQSNKLEFSLITKNQHVWCSFLVWLIKTFWNIHHYGNSETVRTPTCTSTLMNGAIPMLIWGTNQWIYN